MQERLLKQGRMWEDDIEWLKKQKRKMRKASIGDVVHSMIRLIREQKSEGDLK